MPPTFTLHPSYPPLSSFTPHTLTFTLHPSYPPPSPFTPCTPLPITRPSPSSLFYPLASHTKVLVSLACADSTPNVTHEANRCIWKGQCADSIYVPGGKYNCFYNGKPTKLENGTELFELVNKTCPRYLERGKVCCDVAQMNTLHTVIKTAQQLFTRCPACVSNFVNHFCAVTCDPDMSLFMDIPDGSLTQLNDTTWYITSVNVRVTEEYANNLYDSCKSVQYPQASNKVISIMCGGTGTCNPQQWLTFLGDPTQNGESPFPMKYFFSDSVPDHPEMIPRNASTADFYACSDTRNNITCSCSDCPAVCPLPACRTEQILIAAQDSESTFTFQPADGTTSYWTFGPVFNQDVLTEVCECVYAIILSDNWTPFPLPPPPPLSPLLGPSAAELPDHHGSTLHRQQWLTAKHYTVGHLL